MQMLSETQVLTAIEQEQKFSGLIADGAFYIKVDDYVPYICTAVHAGHQFRSSLKAVCKLSSSERLLEEDPFTDELITPFPITLIAHDSRYEYDLNRPLDQCIYDTAWGQQVWKTPLSEQEVARSHAKHQAYYNILKHLIAKLESKFGGCMLVDVHSYNWQVREHKSAPVVNIGTKQIDTPSWNTVLNRFQQVFKRTELPNVELTVARNTVFHGLGYQANFIRQHFNNVLVIPLEFKKVFMDELTGECFPLVLEQLKQSLYVAVLAAATTFNNKLKKSRLKRTELLPSSIEPIVLKVDKALFSLAKNINTLNYVNPINIQQEKRRFLTKRGYEPDFRYRQLRLDPFEFKEKLYKLPVSEIQDPMVRSLYRSTIDSYATKVEMLTHVGKPQFLYNSLRYYGEPSQRDIDNASFLLHSKQLEDTEVERLSAEQAQSYFEQAAKYMGIDCKVSISSRIVAKAMVDNAKRTLLINKSASLTPFEINALIEHEIGVHMVTTFNALQQPLKIFSLGLPGNTYTQEGLAIYREYQSGNINLKRLKLLSLRVLAVNMMVKGESFQAVFKRLNEEFKLTLDEAFSLTVRVFRGGGFTKDYLYLSGFRDVLALAMKRDLSSLYIGKTGLDFIDTLDSLLDRKILVKPSFMPSACNDEAASDPVLDYLVSSIR